MRSHSMTNWSVPVSLLGMGAGAVIVGLGLVPPSQEQPLLQVIVIGVLLIVGGLALLFISARDRVHHEEFDPKMHKYDCPECGHVTHLEDVEKGDPFPCPRCGQSIYE